MEPLKILPGKFLRGTLHRGITHEKQKKLARSFNFTLCYKDDVLSINSSFGDFVDRIYLIDLEL